MENSENINIWKFKVNTTEKEVNTTYVNEEWYNDDGMVQTVHTSGCQQLSGLTAGHGISCDQTRNQHAYLFIIV